MPKWVCKRCGHEFSGWAMSYRDGIGFAACECPDCDGELEKRGAGIDLRSRPEDCAGPAGY